MDWIMLLAMLLVTLGVAGTLLPVMPGVPMVFAGLLMIAWQDNFSKVSVLTMVVIGVIALIAWAVDFAASFMTAKKVGASKQALWGTAIGGLVGLFFGLPGIIFGPAIGAAAGELLAHQNTGRATTVGIAAGLGFVLAMVVKLMLTLLMLGIFAFAYYA
ncbi:MAG: DUF456 domain-containing protein [Methylophilaceae bacterium]